MSDRRTFLRGLVSLPLIGGGVTLVGIPGAPVPLSQAMAAPSLGNPRERARYAWKAFSGAMHELTAGADGWCVLGAFERVTPLPHLPAGAFMRVAAIHYVRDNDPRCPGLIVERHEELDLGSPSGAINTHSRRDHG